MPTLDVQQLTKAYRRTVAVDGLSFSVDSGQVLGLLGPNGAGKTTTLRAIAGILPPTAGQIRIAGHDIRREPVAAKQQLAYVPDDPRLFDALSVWEHLRFVAATYRVADFAPLAGALLDEYELTPKRDALAMELSRGMRQKLAICCAALHQPRLLLLDEPMTGLDPRGIRRMKQSVRRMSRQGTAVLVSSHLLALLEDLCTHLLILDRGQALFAGPLADARATFAGLDTSASLEDLFFRATEGTAPVEPDATC